MEIPARPHGRGRPVHGPAIRLERPRRRHHPRRLRRPRAATASWPNTPTCVAVGEAVGKLNKLLPQPPVHPDGAGALGQPRRHQARRAGSPTRRSTTRPCSIEIARQEGQLRPGRVLRHPFLPGPRRVGDPLPAALPRRRRREVQRALPPRGAEQAGRALPRVRRGHGRPPGHRHPGSDRGQGPARAR
ncbi:MAG: hypothetical protein MZV64_33955 [Ignavibacteriales bacterium]|nr:hypothetical protein [Ignavibacteriales bacterium]